jgi:diguanylate cyclase (GGDEF)-like protein
MTRARIPEPPTPASADVSASTPDPAAWREILEAAIKWWPAVITPKRRVPNAERTRAVTRRTNRRRSGPTGRRQKVGRKQRGRLLGLVAGPLGLVLLGPDPKAPARPESGACVRPADHEPDFPQAALPPPVTAPNPDSVPLAAGSDGRIALHSRWASVALVLVLLGLSAFAVLSTQVASAAAREADVASTLSDNYAQTARAVAAEESLERKYRLEPGPVVLAKYDSASGELLAALALVAQNGDQSDRARVEKVLATHRDYLKASGRMFTAVDKGDTRAVLKIDTGEVDPMFAVIEQTVDRAADAHHRESLAQLAHLRQIERVIGWLTPAAFLAGLLLAALLTSITRGYRRLLDTERRRALHDSMHDALTGLPNRTLLLDRFGQALRAAKRNGTTAGLLLIDLDRFKEVNDTFGHHCGDALLAQIGTRLRSAIRESDTLARLGGDEFAVLIPDITDLGAATALAAKLRSALDTPFLVDGIALDVEASVGVVLSGEHGMDPTLLLQRADIAMYVAKAQNLGVFAYDPDVDLHSPAKLALLGELRRALERDELVLYYQPKVSISTAQVVGAEALVRWQHPERGLVFPDAFIPLAEQTGLIEPLTTYVLGAALTQARAWMDAGQPLMVSVNLSARHLLDERLPRQVADLLVVHGVPADQLGLEVTESALITEPVRAQRLLGAIDALGVRLSIDDFGAGYTSLGELKNLPFTELKIDKSFIMNMGKDPSDALIVQSIIDLGHNLALTIVAEGVETSAALADLTAFGCDIAQGYYLSPPLTAAAFDTWRAARLPTATTQLLEPG